MSNPPLSYYANLFSNKVRAMNDANGKSITLTADEARNLHTDLFALLSKIAELTEVKNTEEVIVAAMDSGKF